MERLNNIIMRKIIAEILRKIANELDPQYKPQYSRIKTLEIKRIKRHKCRRQWIKAIVSDAYKEEVEKAFIQHEIFNECKNYIAVTSTTFPDYTLLHGRLTLLIE